MRDSMEVMQSKVDVFNKKNPVGASVWVVKDLGEQMLTKVKHPAYIMGGHSAMVHVEGISGCYCLDRVV